MTIIPLKLRLSLYAGGLAVASVAIAAAVMLPFIYQRQLDLLDDRLAQRAGELFAHLETFENGNALYGNVNGATRYVPVAMRNFYIQLDGPDGAPRWRSANLGHMDLSKPAAAFQSYTFLEKEVRAASFPKKGFTLHLGTDMHDLLSLQKELRNGTYTLLPVLGLTGALCGWLLGRRALQPVAEITAAAERISAEHLDQRLPVPAAKDDIGRLTRVLNETFDRLQRSFEQAHRFSADASHQLKTPVTVLRADLDELRKSGDLSEKDRALVEEMLHQTGRLTDVIEDLLLLAQADAGRLRISAEPIDLVALIEASLDDVSLAMEERGLRVERQLPPELPTRVDRRRMDHLLQNLADNAVKYNVAGGQIRIAARREGDWAIVTIANTGAPIPAESQPHIFERFHRAGKAEEIGGHGLGLNIADELARAHGGSLRLVRSDAEWTEFELRVPADP